MFSFMVSIFCVREYMGEEEILVGGEEWLREEKGGGGYRNLRERVWR